MTSTTSARTFVDVFRFVWSHWTARKFSFLAICFGLLTSVFLEVQVPARSAALVAALRGWLTGGEAAGPELWDGAVTAAAALLLTFGAVSFIQQLYIRLYIHVSADIMRQMTQEGFSRVQRFGTNWHANHFAGATVRKITRGMWAYDGFADMVIVNLGPAIVLLVAFTIDMSLRDPTLGLYFFASVTAFMIASIAASLYYVAPANVLSNEADTAMGADLADAVTCNAVVKGFGAEAREEARMDTTTRRWRDRSRRAWRRSMDAGASQSILLVALLGGLIVIVMSRGGASPKDADELVYVLAAYFVVNGYLRNVGWQVREAQRAVNELEDLVEIAATIPHVDDTPNAPDFVPGKGEIRVDGVTFQYGRQKTPVFDGLTVAIEPGEKIALVGPSGAGKTTFVKLLQRLYDVDGGRVLIDGQDVREVAQSSLRRAFAIVPQDPILFHRSLADNIAYAATNVDRAAIERAARQAHAHDFIARLPDEYDTLVGERGVKLSGGERQRVAIARAILADAPFLILDEATSSLDSETELLIQQAIEEVLKGRTAILVAHRLSTIRKADRILVFEDGRIVEEGSHDALIARPDGAYRRLHDVQALGFVDPDVAPTESTPEPLATAS